MKTFVNTRYVITTIIILLGTAALLSAFFLQSDSKYIVTYRNSADLELSDEHRQVIQLLKVPVNNTTLSDSVQRRMNKARTNAQSLLLALSDMKQDLPGASYIAFNERINRLALSLSEHRWTAADQVSFDELKRDVMLSHPLLNAQPFLFVTRRQYIPDHHNTATFFPSADNEYNDGKFQGGGALKIINFKTRKTTTLLATDEGVIRDPEIHFDAKRIVFSMRKDFDDSYHIYEMKIDGKGLKQLTFMTGADDLDPFYLADDHIAFSSTREPKYCGCNRHIMANLYRMEPDGSNIYQISKNILFDGHGTLMPDGRILYDRWEYVDRNFGDAQSLWTTNPDGTNHVLYWGNNTPSPGAVIDARIVPGTNQAICVFSSCHDRPWGAIALIDRRYGMDGRDPVVRIWPESAMMYVWDSEHAPYYGIDNMVGISRKYEDPYPLNEKYFICSGQIDGDRERTGLYLLDVFGNETLIYEDETYGCFDPMPITAQQRPPVIPSRRNLTDSTGFFYVQDVYIGTHMEGVKRDEVKYLRIIETPEKRFWTPLGWEGQGIIPPAMNWHDFNSKKIIGTVPVNEDGSAYFEVPSEKFVYFQLLDKNGMMIQSMRSGTMVQPGERTGCTGCHDDRRTTSPWEKQRMSSAITQKPSVPKPWHDKVKDFSYREEVQTVFDRHCIQCHQQGTKAGQKLILTGGSGHVFNQSYASLWTTGYIHPVGAGPAHTLPARSWGAVASKMIDLLIKGHSGVKIDSMSLDKLITWIDLNAPYYPSYATSYGDNPFGRSPLSNDECRKLNQLTGINTLAPDKASTGSVNFDEPEKSAALVGLVQSSPEYKEALQIIRTGHERLQMNGLNDLSGFIYCPLDQWREEKYLARRDIERLNRQSIVTKEKRFDK